MHGSLFFCFLLVRRAYSVYSPQRLREHRVLLPRERAFAVNQVSILDFTTKAVLRGLSRCSLRLCGERTCSERRPRETPVSPPFSVSLRHQASSPHPECPAPSLLGHP